MAQRSEETIEVVKTNTKPLDTKIVKIENGRVTPWIDEAYVPSKPNKFRPVYISLMLQLSDALSANSTFDDIVSEKHFSTYFVTPIFSEPADHKYITSTLVPYLRAVAEAKEINWKVVPSTKKGMLGVVVPGRLVASLIQGMATVKPTIPYLFNFLFMGEE